ncbi:kinase-like protein, partial [Neoconidiobolus thromboides FSU 785]
LNDKKVLTQIYKQVAILKKLEVCPFIIKFYGTHKKSTSFGLITEYASLGNLKEVLASGQTLETPVMINMTTNIVEGVAFLHNLGILHKNIKTSSIMVTSEYKAKISGFEFSRETDVDIYTVPVVDLGSDRHRWIPPEKIRSYAASTQGGDVYSVGMVLWSLWTGRYPYQSFKDRQAVEEYVLNGGREDMTIVNPLILPIIKLCFHEDTNKRPTSAQL